MASQLRVRLKKTVDDSYDIVIGISLPSAIQKLISLNLGSSYAIITDSNVKKTYGTPVTRLFQGHGCKVALLSFPAGEAYKTSETKSRLEDLLLKGKAGRDTVIIGLGGGVVGDLAGFIAATLHRGVPFVQIPTSLLAQVDSSIGGKVAVDHPKGKNLIGAFYQPKIVFIDLATLDTLPDSEFTNGMAEVIKYAAIMDAGFFKYLNKNAQKIKQRDPESLRFIIRRCCDMKRYVVEQDEKETDLRRILNFGHTIGHALESITNFSLSHGQAVAIGMVAESHMSVAKGLLHPSVPSLLAELLALYGLPTTLPKGISLQKLFKATLSDKKAKAGVVHYTLLQAIGKAAIGIPLSSQEALSNYKQ